jgi:hypothetical protein
VPEGRLAVAWIAGARGYEILAEIAARRCGRAAADVLAAPFVLSDQAELAKLFVDSDISRANAILHEGSIRFPSVKEFIRIEVKGSTLADMRTDDAMATLAAEYS